MSHSQAHSRSASPSGSKTKKPIRTNGLMRSKGIMSDFPAPATRPDFLILENKPGRPRPFSNAKSQSRKMIVFGFGWVLLVVDLIASCSCQEQGLNILKKIRLHKTKTLSPKTKTSPKNLSKNRLFHPNPPSQTLSRIRPFRKSRLHDRSRRSQRR